MKTHNQFGARLLTFYGAQLPYHRGKGYIHERLRKIIGIYINRDMEVQRGHARWILNPSDSVEADLFWLGVKDMWETYHTKRMVKSGDVILDVGSNFGYYSVFISAYLKHHCIVHAFEPNPPVFERLLTNICLNDLTGVVYAHRVALGDAKAMMSIRNKPCNSGSGSASLVFDGVDSNVEVITLDGFVQKHGLSRCDYIKVDIEGFEERFLRGARATISRFRPLLMIELCPPVLSRQGTSAKAIMDIFHASNYRLYFPCRKTLQPLTTPPQGEDVLNAFAIPDEKVQGVVGKG